MKGSLVAMIVAALSWTESGSGQWTQVPNPEIRVPISTYAVTSRGDTVWVGTYVGTIYRSTDNGATWMTSDSGISFLYWTYGFLMAGDTLLAFGEEGVFRSTNMGASWEVKNDGLHTGNWMNVYAMVRVGSTLFAATDFGVYRSLNGGDFWYPSGGDSSYWPVFSLAVCNGALFAGTSATGVFRSTDSGDTFIAASTGLPRNPLGYIQRINTLFVDGENIYAGSNSSGIYRTSSYGSLWLPETTGLGQLGNGYFFPICSLAKNGEDLLAGTQNDGIYRLQQLGGSWAHVNAGLAPDAYVTSLSARGGRLLAATQSGLYSSPAESLAWSPLFTAADGKVNAELLGSSGGNLILGASSSYYNGSISGVWRSPTPGGMWMRDTLLTNRSIGSFYADGDSIYAVGSGVFVSSDHGASWREIDSGLPYVNTLLKDENTLFAGWGFDYWTWGERGGIFRSTDDGTTWSELWNVDTAVLALGKIGDTLFAGGLHAAYRSADRGLSWTTASSGLPINPGVSSLRSIRGNLFACTSRGIYRSTDRGDDWYAVNTGLPIDTAGYQCSIQLVVLDDQLLAGTKNGVYVSTNQGTSWRSASGGLTGDALPVRSMTVMGSDLVIATPDGIWRRPLGEILPVDGPLPEIASRFALEQNYPNPFNPVTTIRFSLPSGGHVKLSVFNLLGQEVAVLEDGEEGPGYREVTFHADRFSSGVYTYKITVGKFTAERRMVLIK